MMKSLLACVALVGIGVAVVLAQTTPGSTGVSPGQLQGVPSASGMLYAVLPDGTVKMVTIGAGLTLIVQGGVPTLVPSFPVPTPAPVFATETPAATGASRRDFTLAAVPKAGTLKVYLNGLRQTQGVDYTLTAQTVTFIPYYGDLSTSRVVVDYERIGQ